MVLLTLNSISYGLFKFYNNVYKKVDVNFYFPYLESLQSGPFLEDVFKDNLGQITQNSKNCIQMSLIQNNNQNLNFSDFAQISGYIHHKIQTALKEEKQQQDFKLEDKRCAFTITNPYTNRSSYLFLIGIFNLLCSYVLIIAFVDLKRPRT